MCIRDRNRIQRLLQAVMNLSQLAESDARREEAQLRVRHHAALVRIHFGGERNAKNTENLIVKIQEAAAILFPRVPGVFI